MYLRVRGFENLLMMMLVVEKKRKLLVEIPYVMVSEFVSLCEKTKFRV